MSLPKLTAFIGENASIGGDNEFSLLIKDIKKGKEGEERYVVFLVFDMKNQSIYFKLDKKLNEQSKYDYYYFGNNASASFQYHLTREINSLKYLLLSTYSDLYQTLCRYDLEKGELGNLLRGMEEKGFITISDKKGKGKVNLDRLSIFEENGVEFIEIDENKNILVNGKKKNPEAFIRVFIGDENKKNKYVLIVPKVILEDGQEIILPQHEDYLQMIKKANNLDKVNGEEKTDNKRVCYICHKEKADVKSDYTAKFDRTGINKIFTTTTINSSPFLQNNDYDNVYSICGDCYKKLRNGEKAVHKQFRTRIAGENAFIIPEGIFGDFEYKYLNTLKEDIDLAFKTNDAKLWFETIDLEKDESDIKYYSVNFIIYRTDGNSVTILETIEDVPTLRFIDIMERLAKNTSSLWPHIKNVSIGTIYGLIPVKVDKNGNQQDVKRVLSLYRTIFSGEKISHRVLFSYASEGLDKGLKQLEKSRINNYTNMNLKYYANGKEDFFIKRLIYGYIVLLKTCQDLRLLDKEVFENFENKEGKMLDSINTPSEKINISVNKIEEFLNNQGFSTDARALFYLGILINRVALAQMSKEHKTKPILRKIQFQGMNEKEIFRLYQDVVEKLRQYDKMTLFAEAIMNRFHYYFGALDREWILDEHENVFYIMAGYSYMVGSKSIETTKEDEESEVSE